jgi:hypothetical protein
MHSIPERWRHASGHTHMLVLSCIFFYHRIIETTLQPYNIGSSVRVSSRYDVPKVIRETLQDEGGSDGGGYMYLQTCRQPSTAGILSLPFTLLLHYLHLHSPLHPHLQRHRTRSSHLRKPYYTSVMNQTRSTKRDSPPSSSS